ILGNGRFLGKLDNVLDRRGPKDHICIHPFPQGSRYVRFMFPGFLENIRCSLSLLPFTHSFAMRSTRNCLARSSVASRLIARWLFASTHKERSLPLSGCRCVPSNLKVASPITKLFVKHSDRGLYRFVSFSKFGFSIKKKDRMPIEVCLLNSVKGALMREQIRDVHRRFTSRGLVPIAV